MLTPRRLSLLAGLAIAVPAAAEPLPSELADLVSVDHPDAVVRLLGPANAEDGDAPVIEVVAPASATVRFGDAASGQSSRSDFQPPELLDITFPGEGDLAADIEFLPDGSEILVLHRSTQNITRFDAATQQPLTSIPLSRLSIGFDVTLDGRAVVANYLDDSVSLIDLATNSETLIAVGDAPGWVEVSPDGAFAAVGCTADSTIHVIDLSTNTVARVVNSLQNSQTLGFTTEAGTVEFRITTPVRFIDNSTLGFVARFDDTVSFIDVTTGVRTDVAVTEDPFGIDAANGSILIGHGRDPGLVTLIDQNTLSVTNSFALSGSRTNGPVALNADATKAVIAVQNTTRVLDLTTGIFGPTLNTSNLNDVVANFDRSRVFGVGFSGAVIDFASGNLLARTNDRISTAIGAASPTTDQAAAAGTTFGDDLVIIDTDASPVLQYFGRTGPTPDGDVSLHTAVTPDGSVAVSSNVFSDNLSIFDTATGAKLGLAPLSDRPGEVEISPDGSTAVVCNLDGFEVSVVDLAGGATTAVSSARRLAQVEISPDGAFAYLAQVASGDGVRKLDLATNSFVGGLLATGNLGGVGYSFSQESQIALNPDGNFLAVASSFTDQVFIVDTGTMTVLQTLSTGDFPSRVAFSDDGFYLLVAEKNVDRVRVFFNQLDPIIGVAYASAGTIDVGDQPYDMVVLPDNSRAFVLNWADSTVGVLDPVTLQQTATIPVPFRPMGISLNADGSRLRVAGGSRTTSAGGGNFSVTSEGEVTVIDTNTLAVVERIDTAQPASDLKASSDGSTFAYASPNADGLVLITEDDCLADTNNDGVVSPADYNAWILAFNNRAPECDQNSDGLCTPADFNAWILNFNNGC